MSAGKGSSPRHNLKAYGPEWDRIFGKKKSPTLRASTMEAVEWHVGDCDYTITGRCRCGAIPVQLPRRSSS
jgi:hypothetical protein